MWPAFSRGDAQLAGLGGNLRPVSDAQQWSDDLLSGQKPYNAAAMYLNQIIKTGGINVRCI
jgi:hypothetical protein